jgi:hypothetical protein
MKPLLRIVLRWGVIEVLAAALVGRFLGEQAAYPVSWLVYSLAGRDAARQGKTWHGAIAGGGVTLIDYVAWMAEGAPGHADTSDLPAVVAVLTYATLLVGMIALGAFFGTVGALFGRRARLRATQP